MTKTTNSMFSLPGWLISGKKQKIFRQVNLRSIFMDSLSLTRLTLSIMMVDVPYASDSWNLSYFLRRNRSTAVDASSTSMNQFLGNWRFQTSWLPLTGKISPRWRNTSSLIILPTPAWSSKKRLILSASNNALRTDFNRKHSRRMCFVAVRMFHVWLRKPWKPFLRGWMYVIGLLKIFLDRIVVENGFI